MSNPQAVVRYTQAVKNAVRKPNGHEQMPLAPEYGNESCIYAITTICHGVHFYSVRTPGIATSFDEAKGLVESNAGDIWEYSYSLCVIEALLPNCVYGNVLGEMYWYVWDTSEQKYVAIEEPKEYMGICGWGIG